MYVPVSLDLSQLFLGLGAGAALGFWGASHRAKARMLDLEEAADEALADLRKHDPAAAHALEQPPAVPVANVPAEVTQQQVQDLISPPTPEARKKKAREFIKDGDVADIIGTLAGWRPRHTRGGEKLREKDYEAKLINFMKKKENGFSRDDIEFRPLAQWRGADAGSEVWKKAKPDLAVRTRVLVELKGDLTESTQADRALGQTIRYLLAWRSKGPTILVVCGHVDASLKFLVRRSVESWRKTLSLPVTCWFVGDAAADAPSNFANQEIDDE